jgi:hypothetical protein
MAPASVEETELEQVQRHVREGAGHLAQQRFLIARMRMDGLPTEEAEMLLSTFEDIQRQHEAHRARLEGAAVVASNET